MLIECLILRGPEKGPRKKRVQQKQRKGTMIREFVVQYPTMLRNKSQKTRHRVERSSRISHRRSAKERCSIPIVPLVAVEFPPPDEYWRITVI